MAAAFRFLYRNLLCYMCCCKCCNTSTKSNVKSAAVKYKDPKNGEAGASNALTNDDEIISAEQNSVDGAQYAVKVTWRGNLMKMLKNEENERVSIPMYISLLLISGYIMSGAVLFTLWEDDWDYLVGSYFCFITLTTIGFGDYVPGTAITSLDAQEKMVLCALYLLFGLALIAMCFDLMQEEAKNKFKYIGRKIGCIEDSWLVSNCDWRLSRTWLSNYIQHITVTSMNVMAS